MRELAILAFQTLDGVMQGPAVAEEDTSGDFEHGGWAAEYWPEVMEQVEQEAMSRPFDLLFGRRTYDLFAGHWPNAPASPHGAKLNRATKYVVTSNPADLSWQPAVPITGDVATEIARIKAADGPLLQLHGSSRLAQALLANDLVDEFRLWTFPLVLGAGKRLFDQGAIPKTLRLVKAGTTPNGVALGIYRRKE